MLKEGDKCPSCKKGIIKLEKFPIDKKEVTLPDGTKIIRKKYRFYLACTDCDNGKSLDKTEWR